jgi:hypothetical protein
MPGNKRAAEDWVDERKRFLEDLGRLREEALGKLETQGYEVRGKTPSEIRDTIRKGRRRRFRKHGVRAYHEDTTGK